MTPVGLEGSQVLGPSSNVIRKRTGAPGGGPGSTGFGGGCVQAQINATALTAIQARRRRDAAPISERSPAWIGASTSDPSSSWRVHRRGLDGTAAPPNLPPVRFRQRVFHTPPG